VNRSQSTNDVYPTAIRLAIVSRCQELEIAQSTLRDSFIERAAAFQQVRKIGRTQLQDAVPMTLGQEFGAFAATRQEDIVLLRRNSSLLLEVNLGGTAIGTGINAPHSYGAIAVSELAEISGLSVTQAEDLI